MQWPSRSKQYHQEGTRKWPGCAGCAQWKNSRTGSQSQLLLLSSQSFLGQGQSRTTLQFWHTWGKDQIEHKSWGQFRSGRSTGERMHFTHSRHQPKYHLFNDHHTVETQTGFLLVIQLHSPQKRTWFSYCQSVGQTPFPFPQRIRILSLPSCAASRVGRRSCHLCELR